MSFLQYLKDTRGELRHVSWPTQKQTIVYTVLVITISLFVAAYVGFFDYIFTSSLGNVLEVLPEPQIDLTAPGTDSGIIVTPDATDLPTENTVPVSEE